MSEQLPGIPDRAGSAGEPVADTPVVSAAAGEDAAISGADSQGEPSGRRALDERLYYAVKNASPFRKRLLRLFGILLLVSFVLEVALFNYASWLLVGGDYEHRNFTASSLKISGLTEVSDGVYRATGSRVTIEMEDIDLRIRTLYVGVESKKGNRNNMTVHIDFTDATRSSPYYSPRRMELKAFSERSRYTSCSFSGNTSYLKLTFDPEKDEELVFSGIQVNKSVPFQFSFLRLLLIPCVVCAIYILFKAPSFRKAYDPNHTVQRRAMILTVLSLMMLTMFFYWIYAEFPEDLFSQSAGDKLTDQMNQELVDAFRAGQVSLLDEPPAKLLELDNPYDWGERSREGVVYKWDHVLYNGKYYSYYGIAPVILVYLPYNLLTGYYLPSHVACFLFTLAGTLFLYMAYMVMMANWFPKTPFRLVLCGFLVLFMGSGPLYNVIRPMFYEAAESAGFMFFALGLYFLFSSGINTSRPIKLRYLTYTAVAMALAVLSRPTLALYAVALLAWVAYGLFEYRRQLARPGPRHTVMYLTAALLPYVILGGVQMAYNYARFGSFLEFGIQYSLTINDFTRSEFYPQYAIASFWNMLIALPIARTVFPFLEGNIHKWNMNGYYFTETNHAFGLIWRIPLLFSLGYGPAVLRRTGWRTALRHILMLVVPGLVVPVVIVLATWQSGFSLRYTVDYAPTMILLALALCFFVYGKVRREGTASRLSSLMIVCTVVCVAATLTHIFMHVPGLSNTIYRNQEGVELYYHLAETAEFWL